MANPLGGITVVDLTQVLAGPYCTYQLALLGADVIKIEPPHQGEWMRVQGWSPGLSEHGLGLGFCVQNANKRFLTVNLKEPRGLAIVMQLAATADVFVENFRPGVADRLGLGYEAIAARNPTIIYASISAYGQDGPLGHRGAYDHVVQAMAGIMSTTGMPGSGPTKVGAPYIDYAAGLNGAFAIMAALHERHRTGQSQRVDVAMLDTALLLMANHLVQVAMTGENPAKTGNEAFSGAPSSGCYATQEGLLMLAANSERQFVALCTAIGRSDLATDARFADRHIRRHNQEALRRVFATVFATNTAAAWEAILDTAGVPAAKIRTIKDVLEEGQPEARGLLSAVRPVEGGPAVQVPTAGFKLNGAVLAPEQPPRQVGADTGAILQTLGYTANEIATLRTDGVV